MDEAIRKSQVRLMKNLTISDCPCCGFHEGKEMGTEIGFRVVCESCGLQTAEFNQPHFAIEAWNKRAEYVKRGDYCASNFMPSDMESV